MNYNKILENGDLSAIMGALDHYKTRKSTPKYVQKAITQLQSCQNAIEPLPVYGNELVRTVDGIDFSVAELGIKGVGSVRVNSNQIADRLGQTRHKLNQLIERNSKKLNDYGQMTTVVENHSGGRGRPGKSYMLNQAQTMHVIMHTETEAGHQFTVVFVKAFQQLLEYYLVNRPRYNVMRRENAGTGIYDQLQEERAAGKDKDARIEHLEHLAFPERFAAGAFDASREIVRSPRSRRNPAGHAGKVTRTVVNTVVQ